MIVTFHGVRGSTPAPAPGQRRYGGNTSCVSLDIDGAPPIVFDLGTGLCEYGRSIDADTPYAGVALLTHLHWDHIQGLPFFAPILRPGSSLTIHGPTPDDTGLAEAFEALVCPPYFPVTLDEMLGSIHFHEVGPSELTCGSASVTVGAVPHLGTTNGYRVEAHGVSVAYLSDHQQPLDDHTRVADSVRELCDGVDLLIHDAQYTPEEFVDKGHWGHCTVDYAVHVASECGARRLALFHHDPAHDDALIDQLLVGAAAQAAERDFPIEVLAAAEGTSIVLSAQR